MLMFAVLARERKKLFLSLAFLTLCHFQAARADTGTGNASTFRDGTAVTIDGTIHKVMQIDGGFELYIEDDTLNGKRVYITSKDEQSCQVLSRIHATGTINQPVMGSDHIDWHLTNASFSCQ